jgi:hypothetical protein
MAYIKTPNRIMSNMVISIVLNFKRNKTLAIATKRPNTTDER